MVFKMCSLSYAEVMLGSVCLKDFSAAPPCVPSPPPDQQCMLCAGASGVYYGGCISYWEKLMGPLEDPTLTLLFGRMLIY